jgi:parallel beta-helix repeat protein
VSGTPTIIGVYCGVTPQSTATDLDILFERVEAHHCTGYGFDPHERTTRLRIIACTSHDNGTDGFTLDGCYDFVVQACISYSNVRHGFNFVTASQTGRVIGCDSYSNGSGGYVAQNGAKQITWSGCQAKGNTAEGWVLNGVAQSSPQLDTLPGGFHTLTGNVAIGNGTHGYHLVGATGCRLSGNHAQDNSATTTNTSHHYYLDESGTTYSTLNVLLGNGWSATSGVTNQPKYGIAEKSSNDGPNLVVGNTGAGHVTGDINLLNTTSNVQDAHNGSNGAHPATFAYGSDSPSKHGLVEWNYDPIAAVASTANSTTLASGTVQLVKITAQTGGTVNNIIVNCLALGSTLTSGQNFAAIFDSSGNRLGITADQTTAWGSTGLKTMALTAGVTLTAGADYYIAFLSVGTTPPKFAQTGVGSFLEVNVGLGSTVLRFCTNVTGQTAMPSSLTLSSNSGSGALTIWVGLS